MVGGGKVVFRLSLLSPFYSSFQPSTNHDSNSGGNTEKMTTTSDTSCLPRFGIKLGLILKNPLVVFLAQMSVRRANAHTYNNRRM